MDEELSATTGTSGAVTRRGALKRRRKERWLLTRKTWRYMADAGRRLIPEGVANRREEVPKIEAYFQQVCSKEPRFLLWRKSSYPGALSLRRRGRRRFDKKGGSIRGETSAPHSADEADELTPHLARLTLAPTQSGRFDLFGSAHSTQASESALNLEENQLLDSLERYLHGERGGVDTRQVAQLLHNCLRRVRVGQTSSTSRTTYQDTLLRQDNDFINTLSRHYSRTSTRHKVITDLLTDRRALERLYFDLRQARNFGPRSGATTAFASIPGSTSTTTSSIPPSGHVVQFSRSPSPSPKTAEMEIQTIPLDEETMAAINARRREQEESEGDVDDEGRRRRSSVHEDVSPSVSDTIKRYLRMARKKSVDGEKGDRFKRVNYDRNLRNIKSKAEIASVVSLDDGNNKGCQTDEIWLPVLKDKHEPVASPPPHSTPSSLLASGQTFFSNLIHGRQHGSSTSNLIPTAGGGGGGGAAAMQKSKSSSSVVQAGSRLVSKKIFRTRSKSQTRLSGREGAPLQWTPQGNCVWRCSSTGRQVTLHDTPLLDLNELERHVLQKVALAKLQALSLGCAVQIPTESSTSSAVAVKPKRRAYLLKRKALTTGFFDASRKDDKDDGSNSSSGGLVFGIPLVQCLENDRLAAGVSSSTEEPRRPSRHSSAGSVTSLVDLAAQGSCESLLSSPGEGVGEPPPPGGSLVPGVVRACFEHLQAYGLDTLGIFRVSTSKKRVRQLREEFDRGQTISLNVEHCPHDVATLLKEYFRDLPEPLLCRQLYTAFVRTQRIRNRRLQVEALQHLIQLLPPSNRDTLHALLTFLERVAAHSEERRDSSGASVPGNKMDAGNLATLFAPNILHCATPGELAPERAAERSDVINVVRTMMDRRRELFQVNADLLDEIYVHMMDSDPEGLNQVLACRDGYNVSSPELKRGVSDEAVVSSFTNETETTIRHVWSREECLHETGGTGGPDIGMSPLKHRLDRGNKKRWRDREVEVTAPEFADCVYKMLGGNGGGSDSGVITASLTIPFSLDHDIPYIEDSAATHQMTIGVVSKSTTTTSGIRQRSTSGSDSSGGVGINSGGGNSQVQVDSAIGSSRAPSSSLGSPPPSWASTPPTSPEATTPRTFTTNAPVTSVAAAAQYAIAQSSPVVLHKVSFTSTSEIRQVQQHGSRKITSNLNQTKTSTPELLRSASAQIMSSSPSSAAAATVHRGISSIGGAVLRSKTADFERMGAAASAAVDADTRQKKVKYKRRDIIASETQSGMMRRPPS